MWPATPAFSGQGPTPQLPNCQPEPHSHPHSSMDVAGGWTASQSLGGFRKAPACCLVNQKEDSDHFILLLLILWVFKNAAQNMTINSKWIEDLDVRPKTTNFQKENIGWGHLAGASFPTLLRH